MSKKLPSIQFYPGDWRKDPGIQALDYESRGIWFEILMLMHESERRGELLLNGEPIPDDALARILGLDVAKLKQTLTKLLSYGVASRKQTNGALINRRMLKDQAFLDMRRAAASLGGKQRAYNLQANVKQNPSPSSSSSSSSSSKEALKSPPAPVDNSKSEEPFKTRIVQAVAAMSNGDGEKSKAIMVWVDGKRNQIKDKLPDMEWLTQTIERLKTRESNGIQVQAYGKYLDTLYSKVRTDWLQGEAKRITQDGQVRNRTSSNPIPTKEILPKLMEKIT